MLENLTTKSFTVYHAIANTYMLLFATTNNFFNLFRNHHSNCSNNNKQKSAKIEQMAILMLINLSRCYKSYFSKKKLFRNFPTLFSYERFKPVLSNSSHE